jgi:hypothetical protein
MKYTRDLDVQRKYGDQLHLEVWGRKLSLIFVQFVNIMLVMTITYKREVREEL